MHGRIGRIVDFKNRQKDSQPGTSSDSPKKRSDRSRYTALFL
jgi:hypothetical protein